MTGAPREARGAPTSSHFHHTVTQTSYPRTASTSFGRWILHPRDDRPPAVVGPFGGGVFRRALAIPGAVMLVVPVLAHAAQGPLRLLDGRIPSAQVQTSGSGAITFSGRMVVNGTIPDRGAVQIRDRAGDAEAHLGGDELKFNRRGRVSVRRASGILFVTGSDVQVQVQ